MFHYLDGKQTPEDESTSANTTKTTIIRNGALNDGTVQPAAHNQAVVVQGNGILSVGAAHCFDDCFKGFSVFWC